MRLGQISWMFRLVGSDLKFLSDVFTYGSRDCKSQV